MVENLELFGQLSQVSVAASFFSPCAHSLRLIPFDRPERLGDQTQPAKPGRKRPRFVRQHCDHFNFVSSQGIDTSIVILRGEILQAVATATRWRKFLFRDKQSPCSATASRTPKPEPAAPKVWSCGCQNKSCPSSFVSTLQLDSQFARAGRLRCECVACRRDFSRPQRPNESPTITVPKHRRAPQVSRVDSEALLNKPGPRPLQTIFETIS